MVIAILNIIRFPGEQMIVRYIFFGFVFYTALFNPLGRNYLGDYCVVETIFISSRLNLFSCFISLFLLAWSLLDMVNH